MSNKWFVYDSIVYNRNAFESFKIIDRDSLYHEVDYDEKYNYFIEAWNKRKSFSIYFVFETYIGANTFLTKSIFPDLNIVDLIKEK
jgi:hypothetical protein